jgi:hypothetical protein
VVESALYCSPPFGNVTVGAVGAVFGFETVNFHVVGADNVPHLSLAETRQ